MVTSAVYLSAQSICHVPTGTVRKFVFQLADLFHFLTLEYSNPRSEDSTAVFVAVRSASIPVLCTYLFPCEKLPLWIFPRWNPRAACPPAPPGLYCLYSTRMLRLRLQTANQKDWLLSSISSYVDLARVVVEYSIRIFCNIESCILYEYNIFTAYFTRVDLLARSLQLSCCKEPNSHRAQCFSKGERRIKNISY